MRNKKGQATIFLIFLILGLLLFLIFIFVGGVIVVRMNTALSENVTIGQVGLGDINDDSFGQFSTMYLNNADWWGISLIFGLIIGLFLSAHFTRNSFSKVGIVFDIFIIFAMFLVSLYISKSYSMLLDALAEAGETFLEDYVPKTSTFMLNLPIFIVIVGVISMVLFHSSIPRRQEESYNGGYIEQ